MQVSVLIVEDEPLYAGKMEMQLEKLGYHHQATLDHGAAAMEQVRRQPPDLILMDIHIHGDHDGIELAEMIHQIQQIPVIFVTSLQDDMTFRRAARTRPIAFLTKPFTEIQLQRSIELAVSKLDDPEAAAEAAAPFRQEVFTNHYFFVKNRNRLEKVNFEDILYLEADGRYAQVITQEKKYLLRRPLQELMQKLSPAHFIQTHRSYVINLTRVTSVDFADHVVYLGDIQVPLSKRNKDDFLRRLDRW